MNLNKMQVRGEKHGTAVVGDKSLILTANGNTDWFHHPADSFRRNDVLSLVTEVAEETFSITARVSVEFSSAYDAGAIFLQVDEDNWAKLAFEYSAAKKPTIVSVVTRTTSDDCDGPNYDGEHVWLRVYCDGDTIAFHFSEDGKFWQFLRWFAIPGTGNRPIKVGFGVQSPTGEGSKAHFDQIGISYQKIADLRNGT
ncbi:DUF1349 domain-containing protein [Rhizobium esperanzae]|uniref:Regulation of enolase 1 n=1 Tax=Rhizobium esperanzae TaxID=1967781 RepID=A0A7W6R3S2_9HYPH|nr:DUF1349 domain-containing protein [Rhizobium esperanzae]MBB4235913.1 hypothetical protein [Rhizobium esperanzae]